MMMASPSKTISSISKEDHDVIQNLKANAAFCKALTQKAVAEQRAAELEVQAAVLRTYMKYGMSPTDQIDGEGNIVRVDVNAVPSQEDAK